jgi:hypothetical protein
MRQQHVHVDVDGDPDGGFASAVHRVARGVQADMLDFIVGMTDGWSLSDWVSA